MSRTARIARALTIGYGYQIVVAVTGLVLTPFLLGQLGTMDYGRWLIVGQVLALVGLLDLGVTAVLPREVARASGGTDPAAVAEVVRRAWWLVWLQTPLVFLVAASVWVGVSAGQPTSLGGPLSALLTAFAVLFPLRVPAAVLAGLQDLAFCSVAQAVGWAVTTVVSVVLVLAGWGLYALAGGWVIGQVLTYGLCWGRLRAKFPETRTGGWPGWAGLWRHFKPGLWVSLAQLAQLLVAGTDLLIAGWVLGPAAVVAYSCTTKLVAVLNNQCYSIGLTAQPALAELRGAGDANRLQVALRVAGLAVLALSGAVAIGVMSVNQTFVGLWVGPLQFAGPAITLLAVMAMTTRHVAFGWWSSAYVLGYERRLCGVLVVDGVVTVAAMTGWSALLGPMGIPLGSLTGAVLVYLPTGLFALAGGVGLSAGRVLAWVSPWTVRFALVFGPVAAAAFTPLMDSPWKAGGLAAVALTIYAGLTYQLAGQDPLRAYRDRLLAPIRGKLGWLPRPTGTP